MSSPPSAPGTSPLAHPNVVYLITHDQGIAAACYAPYGPCASTKMVTPHLDRIAASGAILTTHFGTAPQCTPARGSLMTAQPPHVNGLVGLTHRGFELDRPEDTVVHHFRRHGYKTKLVGFQHETTGDPARLGYEEVVVPTPFDSAFALVDEVKASCEAMRADNAEGRPWWLSIGTKEVHLSWEKWTDEADWFDPADVEVPAFLPDTPAIRAHVGTFYAALRHYDRFVGEVWQALEAASLREDTLLVVTTDHGIAHPRAKGTLFDPGNHNLMLWSRPGHVPAGKKVHALLSSVDFAPTVCALCGLPPKETFQGTSYADLLVSPALEETTPVREHVFTELTYHDLYNPMRAVRSDRYKYIRNYEAERISLPDSLPGDIRHARSWHEWVRAGTNTTRAPEEFYDLQADPLEEHNLLPDHPDHPALAPLRAALDEYLARTGDPILDGPYPVPDGARIDNADAFDHVPTFEVTARGRLKCAAGVVSLEMQLTPQNPQLFDVPLQEIVEQYLEQAIVLQVGEEGAMRGRLLIDDEDHVLFHAERKAEPVSLASLVTSHLDAPVTVVVSRQTPASSYRVTIRRDPRVHS